MVSHVSLEHHLHLVLSFFFYLPKRWVFRIRPGGACAQDHDGQPGAASACGGAGGSSDPHDAGALGMGCHFRAPFFLGGKSQDEDEKILW